MITVSTPILTIIAITIIITIPITVNMFIS